MARKRLGEILIEAALIDEAHLRQALTEQRRYGGPLGRVLVDLKLVLEEDLVAALSKQLAVPTIDLDHLEIPQSVLDLVPGEMAEAHGLVPFAQPMKFLDLAMSDPTNDGIIDELRVKTKLNLRPYLAGPKAIERAVARYYGRGVATARGTANRRTRDSVAMSGAAPGERMEVTGGYELDARTTRGPSQTRPPAYATGTTLPPPFEPPDPPVAAPSFAALAALQERVASLEALVRRDEDVIKKLMGLMIEKGLVSRDEMIARLK